MNRSDQNIQIQSYTQNTPSAPALGFLPWSIFNEQRWSVFNERQH